MIELADDAADVSDSVAVGVGEAARVHLVHDGGSPPIALDGGNGREDRADAHLMAPMLTPRIRVRWKMRKKISAGRIPARDAAASAVGSLVYCPLSAPSATETVWFAELGSSTSGRKKSFHVQMKKNVTSTARVGRVSGNTMCQRI